MAVSFEVNLSMHFPLTRYIVMARIVLVLLLFLPNVAFSDSTLTPTFSFEEVFLSNKTATLDESGQITTVSPGLRYENTGAGSTTTINYALNAIYNNDLSQQDVVNHSLDLRSTFTHVPGHWNSFVNGNIRQANTSQDGIQVLNPIIQSDNTEELRTFGIGTVFEGQWTDYIDYKTTLEADYADFENADDTQGNSLELLLNRHDPGKLNWLLSLRSNISKEDDDEEQISTAGLKLEYRISSHYSTFITIEKNDTDSDTDTDTDFLNETNTIIGIQWVPNRNTSMSVGAGKRGDDASYILDAFLRTNRVDYTIDYQEGVTTTRDLLIDESSVGEPVFSPTGQTLSIEPLLVKRGNIAITVTGTKTNITFAYFKETENRSENSIDEEITEGVSISGTRFLSSRSDIRLQLVRQESQSTEENQVYDYNLSYNRQLSKSLNGSVELRRTEQISTVTANESEQSLLTFRLNAVF